MYSRYTQLNKIQAIQRAKDISDSLGICERMIKKTKTDNMKMAVKGGKQKKQIIRLELNKEIPNEALVCLWYKVSIWDGDFLDLGAFETFCKTIAAGKDHYPAKKVIEEIIKAKKELEGKGHVLEFIKLK